MKLVSIYQNIVDPFVDFIGKHKTRIQADVCLVHTKELFEKELFIELKPDDSFLLNRLVYNASAGEAFGEITNEFDYLHRLAFLKAFQDQFSKTSGSTDFLGLSFHEASLPYRWQFAKDLLNTQEIHIPEHYEGPGPRCPFDWNDPSLIVGNAFDFFQWKPSSVKQKSETQETLEAFVKKRPKGFPLIIDVIGDMQFVDQNGYLISARVERKIQKTIATIKKATKQSILEFLFFVDRDEIYLGSFHRDFNLAVYQKPEGQNFLIAGLNQLIKGDQKNEFQVA